jgi:hypothetical protein
MSMATWSPIPSAAEMRLLIQQKNNGLGSDFACGFLIWQAIMTAINAGGSNLSTTASMSGFTAQDIQYWMKILAGLSYTTSYSGTTLTIGWNV